MAEQQTPPISPIAPVAPVDVLVIGAGPAGATAAIKAADTGLSVVLADEQKAAGGQVWRAKSTAILSAPSTPESRAGDDLRHRLSASAATCLFDHRVWQIQPLDQGWMVALTGPEGPRVITARTVILATGAQERIFPVPGWTLPGVIGLAAATALMKGQMILPGQRVGVAGAGPLLPFVAHEILRQGGEVAFVVDLNGLADWTKLTPQMRRRPGLALRGAGWLARLRAAGIPLLYRHGVRRITGDGRVAQVEIGPVDDRWKPVDNQQTRSFRVDAVCLGHGLAPATEATRMLNCRHDHDPALGGWHVATDDLGRTSIAGLYACGDGAGILGAAAAPVRGRNAAKAVLADLADKSGAGQTSPARNLRSVSAFGRAMTSLTIPRDGILDQITPETIVCRCE
ncbi:MAG: FAD-dependent oxidoreductase, partial [Rhodospirillales bacterium]